MAGEDAAAKELRKKSEAGNLQATIELAHLSLLSQQGVEFNADFIFNAFKKGAAEGNSRAHYGLAKCYILRVGTDRNSELALKHAKASAEMNDPQGIRYLGNCYLYGRGMDKPDTKKGIALLKRAIEMGNEMAEYTYAYYLTRNLKDPESNKVGLSIARSLVERGHPDGQHLIGTLYHDGRAGLPKDRKKAMEHYRLAAAQNHSGGLFQVGNLLVQDKKPQEAISWLVKAINRGSTEACWSFAKILREDPDLQEEPYQWVSYAKTGAERGNKWAQDALGDFYFLKAPEELRDWVLSSKYCLLSAEQGRCVNWDRLSSIYLHGGYGVEKDFEKAMSYCEKHFEHSYSSSRNAGLILLKSRKYNAQKKLRIKGYAALITAKNKGAEITQKRISELAKFARMDEEEIQEATELSKTGFPNEGDKMFE